MVRGSAERQAHRQILRATVAASRQGVLVKGAAFLERLAEVDTVVWDKTGTLTRGNLSLIERLPAAGVDADTLLDCAAALAQASTHPASQAISRARPDAPAATAITEHRGLGVTGERDGAMLIIGRPQLLQEEGVTIPAPPDRPCSLVGVAADGRFLGWLLIADEVRMESRQVLADLREIGLERHVMLSGDRRAVAEVIAAELGCDAVQAEALPDDKLHRVEAEQAAGRRVLVIGDGINDALALKAGSVSCAMGAGGTDVALAAADMVLTEDRLDRLPGAVHLARRCRRTVTANVAIALGWTMTMFLLAATGQLGPLMATLLHNLGTVLVIAGRLLHHQGDQPADVSLHELRDWYATEVQAQPV